MAVTLNRPRVRLREYSCRGANLRELWEDVLRNGIREDGQRFAGECVCTAEIRDTGLNIVHEPIEHQANQRPSPSRALSVQSRVESANITYDCEIIVPKCGNFNDLSRPAQNEWKRFRRMLLAHERSHVADFGRELQVVARELGELRAEGHGRNDAGARIDGNRNIRQLLRQRFGGRSIEQRLEQRAAAHDRRTRHGATQGAVLRTDVQ